MAFRPEDKARENIDTMLSKAGWVLQDADALNLAAAEGIAVREFPLKKGHGSADYLLYVRKKVVGVVEAKKEGETLSGVEIQTEKYSVGLPDTLSAISRPLPFLYQTTGVETRFTNLLDPEPLSRDVFSFHQPDTLADFLKLPTNTTGNLTNEDSKPFDRSTLHRRLQQMPEIITAGMRDCQIQAITNLESSLAQNKRRALIQMQTGSGKTYTAVAQAYRLIKFGGAKRILFLVDRGNLARQTLKEFQQYTTPDDGRKFTELYNVQHLQSNKIDDVCQVVITTIQRLYSILKGEETFEGDEEETLAGLQALVKQPKEVEYNPNIPIETFDFVFTDECHRSIYNLWRQVLEYFDCYLVGLTATPSKQTLGYFNQNLVMEYDHVQAVAHGVNVGFEVYQIRTKITEQGSTVEAGSVVDKRDRKSRKKRWQELDDDLTYAPNELDKAVVAPDQIRTVIRTFRERLFTEIFPGRTEVPKTLIFAKDDSHADDIVRILREEFGKGNDFCEKITYRSSTARIVDEQTGAISYKSTGIKAEDLLSSFRNAYNPRVAVTVDMIATGTDIKPLEIVFFMRDVQSANYFEQMKGRGCRVMDAADFQGVTPDAKNKTRYVIIDAVGVTDHCKNDSPPLEKNPSVPLKTILTAIGQGSTDPEVVSTLASRLARLDRIIGESQRKELERLSGVPLQTLIQSLVNSVDPDSILEYSDSIGNPTEEGSEYMLSLGQHLREKAVEPFLDNKVRDHILNSLQDAEQTIDIVSKDELTFAGASAEATERAKTTIESFAKYIEENRDEITAIQLLYSRRKGKGPSLAQLKELANTIQQPPRSWTPEALWRAYEALEKSKVKGSGGKVVTDLVSLVRFALAQETILRPFGETVDDRFAVWLTTQEAIGRKFNSEERQWLEMIRDHVATSLTIEPDDFDVSPFAQAGGLGKAYQVFGERLTPLLKELNEVLVA